MAQPKKLPEVHTDLIVSVRWESGDIWILIAIVAVCAAALAAVLVYRRRRRKMDYPHL